MTTEHKLAEALRHAKPLVEKWCFSQGNDLAFLHEVMDPIDEALRAFDSGQKQGGDDAKEYLAAAYESAGMKTSATLIRAGGELSSVQQGLAEIAINNVLSQAHPSPNAQVSDLVERLRRELAAEREKFTMHTAQVGAWLSAFADLFAVAKAGETVDVATCCSSIMDAAEALQSQHAELLTALTYAVEEIEALYEAIGNPNRRKQIVVSIGQFGRLRTLRDVLEGKLK